MIIYIYCEKCDYFEDNNDYTIYYKDNINEIFKKSVKTGNLYCYKYLLFTRDYQTFDYYD